MTNVFSAKTLPAMVLLIAGLSFSTTSLAGDRMELTIAPQEIPGTSEIESGNFTRAIPKLNGALNHANNNLSRSPALVNLCAAHTASGDLEQADDYCAAAIDTGVNVARAYNNKAVINCLQGNVEVCVEDLERAASLRNGNRVIQRNLARARTMQSATLASNN